MAVKRKAVSSAYDGTANSKRQRRQQHEFFESQDIWKNLNKISTNLTNSSREKKNSQLFIPVYTATGVENAKVCVEALQEFIETSKIEVYFGLGGNRSIGFVRLRNFNILDCCLVLSVILAARNKNHIISDTKNMFTIPQSTALAASFYLPSNFTYLDAKWVPPSGLRISEVVCTDTYNFKEFHVSLSKNRSLSIFIEGIASFLTNLKFGKCKGAKDQDFRSYLSKIFNSIKSSIYQTCLPKDVMFDSADLVAVNRPKIEKSKENLLKYAKDIINSNKYDGMIKPASEPVNDRNIHVSQSSRHDSNANGAPSNRYRAASRSTGTNLHIPQDGHPAESANTIVPSNYMTQEQIKQHCQATVSASMDALKSKSPYQIFTMYVKCPRQKYTDIVYQSLNDLRTQSNCNIVVLNLNNLNESKSWFDTLDTSKYTAFTKAPHPSTVRVISIGGVGEHMMKALELISRIMEA
ncbi:hypothetical protein HG535_0F05110 [Zygotorulaspora mrakii]|uniref:Uncharacterized protein n=1 Tax=Zygotorulaspora mrakii TaxID=42260 RepID=A0A7H9B7P3_ZYGMR|nr:uncharacterized protein HG535_0F05110 [Zygotorulaspora mrakii]QLG73999.1 hypothetical protein HG535_0F05110 [Zygotorulaspora mrakii]